LEPRPRRYDIPLSDRYINWNMNQVLSEENRFSCAYKGKAKIPNKAKQRPY